MEGLAELGPAPSTRAPGLVEGGEVERPGAGRPLARPRRPRAQQLRARGPGSRRGPAHAGSPAARWVAGRRASRAAGRAAGRPRAEHGKPAGAAAARAPRAAARPESSGLPRRKVSTRAASGWKRTTIVSGAGRPRDGRTRVSERLRLLAPAPGTARARRLPPAPAPAAGQGALTPGSASRAGSSGSRRSRRSTRVVGSGVSMPSGGSGRPARTRSTPETAPSSHACEPWSVRASPAVSARRKSPLRQGEPSGKARPARRRKVSARLSALHSQRGGRARHDGPARVLLRQSARQQALDGPAQRVGRALRIEGGLGPAGDPHGRSRPARARGRRMPATARTASRTVDDTAARRRGQAPMAGSLVGCGPRGKAPPRLCPAVGAC